MAEVVIHRLAGMKKALEACRLVDALYSEGKRVVVWCADAGRAKTFDDYLWTHAQQSFVPHSLWTGDGEADDPVVVATNRLGNPNNASVLVVVDRLMEIATASAFAEIHDFVTVSPEDEGKEAQWQGAGYSIRIKSE